MLKPGFTCDLGEQLGERPPRDFELIGSRIDRGFVKITAGK
jgi:hypothetical protein